MRARVGDLGSHELINDFDISDDADADWYSIKKNQGAFFPKYLRQHNASIFSISHFPS
jgi:hypothetical protein